MKAPTVSKGISDVLVFISKQGGSLPYNTVFRAFYSETLIHTCKTHGFIRFIHEPNDGLVYTVLTEKGKSMVDSLPTRLTT